MGELHVACRTGVIYYWFFFFFFWRFSGERRQARVTLSVMQASCMFVVAKYIDKPFTGTTQF